jgi:phospholipase C
MGRLRLCLIACVFLLPMAPRAIDPSLERPARRTVAAGAPAAPAAERSQASRRAVIRTATPITHAIVIIGENRSFDHVYATYVPNRRERVSNLLSKGIVNVDGSPGPRYLLATQFSAVSDGRAFATSPASKMPYTSLPPVGTGTAPTAPGDTTAPFVAPQVARSAEPDLPPAYASFLLTGATGLPNRSVDTRVPDVFHLRDGVFQLTPSVKYDDYTASPVHRFYQMWQQLDCSASRATKDNPSGCQADLFPWVETTVGAGSNGNPQEPDFGPLSTGEGSTAMAFYNVAQGDAPYMKRLADRYTLGDNFHQSVMGGTGANHIMFGYGDLIWYSNPDGTPGTPPANQIENPNPQPGTNNYYDQDGYSGGSYTNCADVGQPGVAAIVNYLESLPRPIATRCEPGRFYLLNNYGPGFAATGEPGHSSEFTIPPTSIRHIGDALLDRNISFKYYGEHWDREVNDPNRNDPLNKYCPICNPFQYATDIMTNPALRAAHIQDAARLYDDIRHNTLPAVSIVKPSGFTDGHPASSKLDLFEGFVARIVRDVQANRALWQQTAIFITFDEGGGYYDSGYVQPLDFFGDGTRVPFLVVSPYSTGGHVKHEYTDHVSILKFIERNWRLKPLTTRSRDNLPQPVVSSSNPYVPLNSPAIGDLFSMFDFAHPRFAIDN